MKVNYHFIRISHNIADTAKTSMHMRGQIQGKDRCKKKGQQFAGQDILKLKFGLLQRRFKPLTVYEEQ
jgi:hypothetical protein